MAVTWVYITLNLCKTPAARR